MKTWIAAEVLFASDLNAEFNSILNNPISLISPVVANIDGDGFDLVDLGELEFRDEAADPTADGRMRRSGDELTWRTQDARTNTVTRNWTIWADTTGAPAANIGIGMLFQAESADENPADFGALDFVASDIGAGTEDTYASVLLRVAGRALDEKYRFSSTAGDGFAALFTHAVTADRTYTLPDSSVTLAGNPTTATADVTTSETTTSATYTDLATVGPAVTLTPGRTTDQMIFVSARIANNTGGQDSYISPAIAGAAASDVDAFLWAVAAANYFERGSSHTLASSVANASTHTAKYRVAGGTGTFVNRRISAFTLS